MGITWAALEFDADAAQHGDITIVLIESPQQLPEIAVRGLEVKPLRYAWTTKYDDFFRRRKLGAGHFILRDDIDRKGAFRTVELLERVPGVRVAIRARGDPAGTTARFSRCNTPPRVSVWIDGQKMIQQMRPGGQEEAGVRLRPRSVDELNDPNPPPPPTSIVAEMLDRIDPTQIEVMEVYQGPGIIPAEYLDDSCAVVAIWTRAGGKKLNLRRRSTRRANRNGISPNR